MTDDSPLPTFSDATEAASDAADAVRQRGRTLIPWLSDPPTCDDCGALLYASETFDPVQVCTVASWECRECDAADRYRDPAYGDDRRDGPREGSDRVRAVLRDRDGE